MTVPVGHFYTEPDGTLVEPGHRVEVGAPFGRQLAEHGYDLVSVRHVPPRG
jgi:hypothetical protein